MEVSPQERRTLTDAEKPIEANYKLAQFTRLLSLVGKEIGTDKIIEIAKSNEYPKTKEQIIEMIEKGKGLKDLDRYDAMEWIDETNPDKESWPECNDSGDWVKWSDIEKIIG